MKKLLIGLAMLCWLPLGAAAQNEIDLLRFALNRHSPTARMAAMGGAFTALGADMGGMSLNPAGIAAYRRSTVSFSPGLNILSSQGNYLGQSTGDRALGAFIGNLGYVYSKPVSSYRGTASKWKQINYGFTLNRVNNFTNNVSYRGINTDHSLVDLFVNEANSDPVVFQPDDFPFTASLARTAGLIFPSVNGNDSSLFLGIIPNAGIEQSDRIRTRGSTQEYAFSFGANYDNILQLGATVALVSSNFSSVSDYKERDHMDTIFDFKEFTFQQRQYVTADGAVIKLGAILQPVSWLRLGLAYESPTWYTVSDDYQTKIEANYDTVPVFASAASPLFLPFTYSYNKPGRISAGVAFMIGKRGSVSIDYDYIDYSSMQVENNSSVDGASWARELNNITRTTFRPASNVRVGGEFIHGPLAYRAGFAYWGSPYQEGINTGGADYSRMDYTLGAGVKLGKLGIDLSVVHNRMNGYWAPYFLEGRNNYDVRIRNYQTLVQLGLNFRLD